MKKLCFIIACFVISISLHSQAAPLGVKNVRVSSTKYTDPNETAIAINPKNPMNLIAGANIQYYYYSFDGGLTWAEKSLASNFGVWGDPCIIFDKDGASYYGHLSNPPLGSWIDRIVVQKSTDGGASWNAGAGIGLIPDQAQDKEWMVADYGSPKYAGNIYMSWTHFDHYGSYDAADKSMIKFASTSDAGATWSDAIVISDSTGDCVDDDATLEGAVPAVDPEGNVYVAWSAHESIYFDKSTDAGKTWGKDKIIVDQPGGWTFDILGINRCNGLPTLVCDVSPNKYGGRLYLVWSDQRNGPDDADVFLIYSTDKGDTWTKPIRVNDDPVNRHNFLPWICVDPVTGAVYVAFYDRRSTQGKLTDVYLARSTDGGNTFENFKINETSFSPNTQVFFGDYINVAAYNGKIYTIYMRMDNSKMSVWCAIADDKALGVESVVEKSSFISNYPNPFSTATMFKIGLANPERVRVEIYGQSGELVAVAFDDLVPAGERTIPWEAADFPVGVYYYKIKAGAEIYAGKCLLVR